VDPCHYTMGRPQAADGGWPLIWRVAANIRVLNKKSQTAGNG